MQRLGIVFMFACCAGCCFLRDESASRELAARYAMPQDLSLSIALDRTARTLDVTLKMIGKRDVYENYCCPGFKLFCVSTNGEVTVLRSRCDMISLHSIPELKPGEEISYTLPLECFAFLTPELQIQDCSIFLEYNSRYGSTCSNALRIGAPLSLGPLNDGKTYRYRAMDWKRKANHH